MDADLEVKFVEHVPHAAGPLSVPYPPETNGSGFGVNNGSFDEARRRPAPTLASHRTQVRKKAWSFRYHRPRRQRHYPAKGRASKYGRFLTCLTADDFLGL